MSSLIVYALAGIGGLVLLALVLYWITITVAILRSRRYARVVADPVLKAEDEALAKANEILLGVVPDIVRANEIISKAHGLPKS